MLMAHSISFFRPKPLRIKIRVLRFHPLVFVFVGIPRKNSRAAEQRAELR